MKAGGGKSKGSSFEREVCVKLSKWISDGKRDDIFWRSAMSGGRATVGSKKNIIRNTQVGDITSVDPLGNKLTNKYIIECKYYKNIHVESLLFGKPKNNSIYEFWIKLNKQCIEFRKDPILIIKQNNLPTLMGIDSTSPLVKSLKDIFDISPLVQFNFIIHACYLYEFEYVLNISDPRILN